jgi:hypothetical protein
MPFTTLHILTFTICNINLLVSYSCLNLDWTELSRMSFQVFAFIHIFFPPLFTFENEGSTIGFSAFVASGLSSFNRWCFIFWSQGLPFLASEFIFQFTFWQAIDCIFSVFCAFFIRAFSMRVFACKYICYPISRSFIIFELKQHY